MDFDDLLADPFEDPFAKPRSGSPDPWASFSHQAAAPSDVQDAFADSYNSVYDENRSTTSTTESYVTGERGESSQSSVVDPLEASVVNAEENDSQNPSGPTSPRTPGFRESISVLNPTDHTQTIAEPEPATPTTTPTPPPIISPLPPASVPARAPSPPPSDEHPSPSHSRSTSKVTSPIISPLERPLTSSGIDRSFAGLALGGESIGGWQTEQGSWANDQRFIPGVSNVGSATEEDDDDDDQPILKTLVSSYHVAAEFMAECMEQGDVDAQGYHYSTCIHYLG